MTVEEILARLRQGLRAEARKHYGRIGELELRAGLARGEISNLYSERKRIKLDVFLRALLALGTDPAEFFSRVLGGPCLPDAYLEPFVAAGEQDRELAEIERAGWWLEAGEAQAADPAAVADAARAAEMAQLRPKEQQRRLRHTRRYRTVAFARAYLEHLDSLRYDHAEVAAKLATTVAVDLLPKLPGPRPERLALQCLALGIFASARRLKGRFSTAARAFRLALDLARRHRLREDTARLLQRASYLLKDFGQFERALVCLREALEIYVGLGCDIGIGKTLVEQGLMLTGLGDHKTATQVLSQALRYLNGNEARLPRYHFAAYQYLAIAFEQLGELDAAEARLEEATGISGLENGFYSAKLRWQQGTLAFKRGDCRRSEGLLRAARKALAATENPGQEALVSLDVLDVLLAQGKLEEACSLAGDMARLLDCFEDDRLAARAIVRLIRPTLAGKLSRAIVAEARADLEKARTPERGALLLR